MCGFLQEEESLRTNGESRGCIQLSELVVDAEVEVNGKTFEIVLKTKTKDYQLKAGDPSLEFLAVVECVMCNTSV